MYHLILLILLSTQIILSQETKTITGNVVDQDGKFWNDQIVELYEGENLVNSDTLENGYFSFENVLIVSVENETIPKIFSLDQNYPNPFNPSTIIGFTLNKTQNVSLTIYDILGRKVKTLVNQKLATGTYTKHWYADNEFGSPVSAGVYIYVLEGNNSKITKKMVLLDGANNVSKAHANSTGVKLHKSKLEFYDYTIKIYGEDVITKSFTDFDFSVDGSINIGTLTAEAKPVAEMFLYDLDSKYPEENNHQETTPKGVSNLIVFDGNNLDNWTTADSNGIARLKFDEKTFTTLYVAGTNQDDTTHYFFKLEADINQYGAQKITGFRDTTGIPIIKRETIEGWDIVEWMNWISEIRLIEEDYNGKKIHTTSRISDSKLPIKVFLDRANAPESYMADQALRAMDSVSHGRTQYIETADSNEATGFMRYHATNALGWTRRNTIQNNDEGRAIRGFQILMNTTNNYINQEHFGIVVGHELSTHTEKFNGVGFDPNSTTGYYHSPNINDISFAFSGPRYNAGINSFRSEKEKRENEILYALPNGFLSLDIIRSNDKIDEFFNNFE